MYRTSQTIDDKLIEIYKTIFPEVIKENNEQDIVKTMNGLFGSMAVWKLIEIEKKIIAFATIGFINGVDQAFIYNVGVHSMYRNQGYGSLIMQNLTKEYQNFDLFLFVNKDNRVAIKLYRKFEFEFCDDVFHPPNYQICLKRAKKINDSSVNLF